MTDQAKHAELRREIGIPGAVLLGLGSIVGTGVFISIAIAANIAQEGVILATIIGGLLAGCNGLSSAQLAASHPVSGGTYEYGYRYLNPTLGFMAGWMFLCAKSASAATAALGCANYMLIPNSIDRVTNNAYGVSSTPDPRATAMLVILVITFLVLSGVRRSNHVNATIVGIAGVALAAFVVVMFRVRGWPEVTSFDSMLADRRSLIEASALMFVAFTGYGRIATMGEEVRDPRRSIPIAIIATLVLCAILYAAVACAYVTSGAVRLPHLAGSGLKYAAFINGQTGLARWLSIAAPCAMAGVLLNLFLGLSRVLLAMARRRDVPGFLSQLNAKQTTPTAAVIAVAVLVGGLVLIGDVKTTWSFSAFTVLVYYALTNLAAIRMPREERRFPLWISWLGFGACLTLAFAIDPRVWATGLCVLLVGLAWFTLASRRRGHDAGHS
jgi:APA family basic amino acid/polyamine antiporter